MKGKVAMVTGANAGMGREISLALAGMGATLVMVCRDRQRGEAARRDVMAASRSHQVELLLADLSSQKSIRELAREFSTTHDRLNVLVNNAGMSLPARQETADGIETVFATNHLGPFLLTNLLVPALTASAPSRVVTVSSGVQAMAKIDFDDLQSVKSYSEIRSYNQSKLANLLFTYELARRLEGTGVTANALEPGFIKTNLKVPFPFSLFSFMRGKPAGLALERLLEANAGRHTNVFVETVNRVESSTTVQADRFLLVNACLEHQPLGAHGSRRALEMVEDLPRNSSTTHRWIDVHPLDLDCGGVAPAQSPATDRPSARARNHESADARRDVHRFQMMPKPLLRRVAACQVRIQGGHQPSRVGRVKRLGGDRDLHPFLRVLAWPAAES